MAGNLFVPRVHPSTNRARARHLVQVNEVPKIIEKYDTSNSIYLDYGGGYGIFVRLMRDKGFNFYLSEIYADNLFCKHFTFEDAGIKTGFTSLTSFEVFEHLLDPMADIKTMFSMSDTIIFSTQLQPNFQLSKSEDWWYFVPEGGQHISFYSIRTLEVISEIFNCYLYSNGTDIHILTKKIITNPFKDSKFNYTLIDRLMRWVKKKPKNEFFLKETLLYKDFDFYKKIINGRNI